MNITSALLSRTILLLSIFGLSNAAPVEDTVASAGDAVPAKHAPLTPGNHFRTLLVDGRGRSYLVHVPPNYDPERPTPVVLVFHGAAMNGSMMELFCGLNKKADSEGFITVYPNGTGKLIFFAFNPTATSNKDRPDDVAYVARLLDDLESVTNVDPKRVFATGLSNGGMMCYRLALDMADRIAAIAPVAGTLIGPEKAPSRPVPVLHFHGTSDTLVPFGEPDSSSFKFLRFRTVDETMRLWARLDGCPDKPAIENLPDIANDGTTVERETFGPGQAGSEVVLIKIAGGGHTWPGMQPWIKSIGRSTKDISANDLIWDFFVKHPMP